MFELGNMEAAREYLTEFLSHPVVTSHTDPYTRLGMKDEAQEMLDRI
jgi:hypothetical protein